MPDSPTDQHPTPGGHPAFAPRPWGMDENVFCLLLHLSPLTPGLSFIMTLVMWLTQKDQNPRIDAHGRVVLNWLISMVIYLIVSALLVFVIIGIFTFFATVICNLVFMIIGAVKASKGETWVYPLSIPFLGRPDAGYGSDLYATPHADGP